MAPKPKTAAEYAAARKAEEAQRQHDLYGSHLADVQFLRSLDFAITREGDGFRIGPNYRTHAELKAIVERERRLRQPAPPASFGPLAPLPVAAVAPEPEKPVAIVTLPESWSIDPATQTVTLLTCEECGGPRSVGSVNRCRDCYRGMKRVTLLAAIGDGASIGEAARAAGVSKSTAHKHAERHMPADLRCGCGRPNSHQGRCWARRGWAGPSGMNITPDLFARVAKLEAQVAALSRQMNNGAPA